MKVFCNVNGKHALIVGYGPGRKGRPMAIVITEGKLKAIRLKDIDLDAASKAEPDNVAPLARKRA